MLANSLLTLYITYAILRSIKCIYCGSKWEDIKPIIEAAIKPLLDGVKSLSLDDFKTSRLDAEALESKKIDGYNPFKTTYLE